MEGGGDTAFASFLRIAKSPAVLTTAVAVGIGAVALLSLQNAPTTTATSGEKKPMVLVVGGGIAGSLVASLLQDDADVTLIDEKEYMEVRYATPRCVVEPRVATRSCIRHSDYLTKGSVLKSKVVGIFNDAVETEDGAEHAYDYLVLAVGKSYPTDGPPYHTSDTWAAQVEWYQQDHKALQGASSLLIVGGGPVGVELAAEIITDFPSKKVTLVHKGERLLEFLAEAHSAKALEWLTQKGVTVIFNDRVDFGKVPSSTYENKAYVTKAGIEIEAELVFLTTGFKPATGFMRKSVLSHALNASGQILVNEDLRVVGCKNVFAIGDCTAIEEAKQGYLASMHAEVAANNIKALIKSPEATLSTYRPPKPEDFFAIVSLGRDDGLLAPPNGKVVTGFLPAALKSKALFVPKVRGDLRLYTPPLASPFIGLMLSLTRGMLPSSLLRYLPA